MIFMLLFPYIEFEPIKSKSLYYVTIYMIVTRGCKTFISKKKTFAFCQKQATVISGQSYLSSRFTANCPPKEVSYFFIERILSLLASLCLIIFCGLAAVPITTRLMTMLLTIKLSNRICV